MNRELVLFAMLLVVTSFGCASRESAKPEQATSTVGVKARQPADRMVLRETWSGSEASGGEEGCDAALPCEAECPATAEAPMAFLPSF